MMLNALLSSASVGSHTALAALSMAALGVYSLESIACQMLCRSRQQQLGTNAGDPPKAWMLWGPRCPRPLPPQLIVQFNVNVQRCPVL